VALPPSLVWGREAAMTEARGRVIVGVADSPSGLRALRWAVEEARRRGTVLCAVRGWRFHPPWNVSDAHRWWADFAEAARATVYDSFARAVGGVPADLTVEVVVAEGTAGQVVIDQAGEDDLVVVGTSTWSGFFSMARYCLRHATCPVVTVPAYPLGRRAKALAREVSRNADDYLAMWAEQSPSPRRRGTGR
jgi:nucleotide-binding universal stress UspA family protein